MNRRQLYAFGEPLGECATRLEAGRLVCGGGGGGGQTSTTTQTVPQELKGAATAYSNLATNLANTPYQAYTGQGVAGLNNYQQQAIDQIQNRASNGSPILDTANSTLTGLLGDNTNPYLDQQVANAQKSVTDAYNNVQRPAQITAAVNSGSFGNSGLEQAQRYDDSQLQQNLGNIATSMYGNAYNTNQANKLSALGMAQSYGNQDYTDAGQLLNAGTTAYNNTQDQNDFQYQQYQNQQNYPLQQLSALSGVISGSAGQTTKTSGGGK